MRPTSIVWFERIYVVAVAMGCAAMLSAWLRVAASFDPLTVLVSLIILLVLPMSLALLVSRRRSRVGLVLLVSWTWLLGASFLVSAYLGDFGQAVDYALFAAQMLAVVATFLLFTPSARDWLRASRSPPVSSEKLKRTFE